MGDKMAALWMNQLPSRTYTLAWVCERPVHHSDRAEANTNLFYLYLGIYVNVLPFPDKNVTQLTCRVQSTV